MPKTAVRLSPSVRASISPDGLVLLDVQGGLLLASNTVGACIWQMLEQQRAPADIARQIAKDYRIDVERAERDVTAFIDALGARGLTIEEAAC